MRFTESQVPCGKMGTDTYSFGFKRINWNNVCKTPRPGAPTLVFPGKDPDRLMKPHRWAPPISCVRVGLGQRRVCGTNKLPVSRGPPSSGLALRTNAWLLWVPRSCRFPLLSFSFVGVPICGELDAVVSILLATPGLILVSGIFLWSRHPT